MSEGREYLERKFKVRFGGGVSVSQGINYDTVTFERREDAETLAPLVAGVVKHGMLAGMACGIIREERREGGGIVYTMVMT